MRDDTDVSLVVVSSVLAVDEPYDERLIVLLAFGCCCSVVVPMTNVDRPHHKVFLIVFPTNFMISGKPTTPYTSPAVAVVAAVVVIAVIAIEAVPKVVKPAANIRINLPAGRHSHRHPRRAPTNPKPLSG